MKRVLGIPVRLGKALRGLTGLVLLASVAEATWSIVVVDRATGEVCVATATCLAGFNIANAVPVVVVGKGAAAAQSYIEAAVELGVDAFLTGEASEQTVHVARECGIDFYAAGHHATEREGARALGEHLAAEFGLDVAFVDIPNPV